MQPTGLYTLGGATAVDFELSAYAEALDSVSGELRELQAESFVSTASGYGLELGEQAFALPAAGGTEARRAAVLTLGSVKPGDFTKARLEATFAALGLAVGLEEDPAGRKIVAKFQAAPSCGEAEAQKKLEIFSPAHLTVESDFTGVS